ncbi:MAG: sulfatase-like hydrolase/transferase, partial [Phycisphaeraceae bacterium]|nr:sulfatase-like hydrolase/transferase [Phycisphaeraceae bacterium]
HEYYTMIAAMDDHIGRVINGMKAKGVWDDTLVIMTSDHGDMMGAHRLRLKGTLPYDELYRVPLIVKPPASVDVARPVVDDLVSLERLAGTIARGAGLEDHGFAGGDFWTEIISDQPPTPPDEQRVFFEHYAAYWGVHPFYGVRTQTHKVIRYYGEDDTVEMYDLAADPHELHNVADDPAYAAVRDQLLTEADAWWAATDGRTAEEYASEAFKGFEAFQMADRGA